MKEEIIKFLENNPKIEKILKKDHRSYVFTFMYQNKLYVYKEPIEKNTRKWQRFLAIFRGRESKREFKQMQKINSLGFKTATPIFYEKNFLVYEYVDGRKPFINENEINLVVEELKKIHSKGFLHGDSHLANFLITNKNEIYIIDSKFQKNKYGKFGEIFELMYLEKSLEKEISYDKTSIYYKIALLFKKFLTFLSNLKNFIRRK
ncbi:MAG: lipopolysaccharide core heptose(II) kinase RfaY [Fusobacterium gastrosuis]|uniref:lipopolysaccharide core heptose(II) kinase RfaY n=1 Tax=Fusobacterium TaxID=848 RepID=UPI0025BEE552|nr:lipopolysaccharide core heptose(II) kinase RfaY [Fusobacterium sp.]MDD7410367.1 lipopolysaccharide core heptose(II) kinase RfaY [Fusobacteriaceae bacterium]MDY4011284.1 lipopolysaccharide core heptose(II) kinase RfaY [Fusobacterium gastrosuis]MCI5725807.1 AarF/UbiB family protein [Fusobacterium sp.]MCI7223565.1 AarF/UbiB family protein [Fusobacterium sp.]MDY5713579.1 lipopolysaccharide core heptose(II) kinase RfaY [Fusobacterium gastrosuis]